MSNNERIGGFLKELLDLIKKYHVSFEVDNEYLPTY